MGSSKATHLRTSLVLATHEMAVHQRKPEDAVHHSDHGCPRTPIEFGSRCRAAGVRPSTGTVGDRYHNATFESLFATLEREPPDQIVVVAKSRAKTEVFRFIEGWTNPRRRHSALGHLSPVAFERLHSAPQEAACLLRSSRVSAQVVRLFPQPPPLRSAPTHRGHHSRPAALDDEGS